MKDQEVKYIRINNLVLWTENPRDPIGAEAQDQDVVDRALGDSSSKWNLEKLAKEMGDRYDFSELPTVVYHGDKPVVYDGNRRVILGKIKLGIVQVNGCYPAKIPDFPLEIPCNVCSEEIALKNVYRKHADTGSWLPLERDIFLNKHMKEDKSSFLILDEHTGGLIRLNKHLNQRFVKEEILNEENLKKLGFEINNSQLLSKYDIDDALAILNDLSEKIRRKEISTRKRRGQVIDVLDQSSCDLIESNKNKKANPIVIATNENNINPTSSHNKQKKSKRTKPSGHILFGGPLYLEYGEVNDLYRDIVDLYQYYIDHKSTLSNTFTALIRMGLRLLSETAAKSLGKNLDNFVTTNFDAAKANLDQDIKTTLSNQNVSKKSITQLLHTGAHNYSDAANLDQTIAISIILGQILSITHKQGGSRN